MPTFESSPTRSVIPRGHDFVDANLIVSASRPDLLPSVRTLPPVYSYSRPSGRGRETLSVPLRDNGRYLLSLLGKLSEALDADYVVINSGWRPQALNDSISGASNRSQHLEGLAADVAVFRDGRQIPPAVVGDTAFRIDGVGQVIYYNSFTHVAASDAHYASVDGLESRHPHPSLVDYDGGNYTTKLTRRRGESAPILRLSVSDLEIGSGYVEREPGLGELALEVDQDQEYTDLVFDGDLLLELDVAADEEELDLVAPAPPGPGEFDFGDLRFGTSIDVVVAERRGTDADDILDDARLNQPTSISMQMAGAVGIIDLIRTDTGAVLSDSASSPEVALTLVVNASERDDVNRLLRPLVAMTKRHPFVPVRNADVARLMLGYGSAGSLEERAREVQQTSGDEAIREITEQLLTEGPGSVWVPCLVPRISVASRPGTPRTFDVSIVLRYANTVPYTPGLTYWRTTAAAIQWSRYANVRQASGLQPEIVTPEMIGGTLHGQAIRARRPALAPQTASPYESYPFRKFWRGLLAEFQGVERKAVQFEAPYRDRADAPALGEAATATVSEPGYPIVDADRAFEVFDPSAPLGLSYRLYAGRRTREVRVAELRSQYAEQDRLIRFVTKMAGLLTQVQDEDGDDLLDPLRFSPLLFGPAAQFGSALARVGAASTMLERSVQIAVAGQRGDRTGSYIGSTAGLSDYALGPNGLREPGPDEFAGERERVRRFLEAVTGAGYTTDAEREDGKGPYADYTDRLALRAAGQSTAFDLIVPHPDYPEVGIPLVDEAVRFQRALAGTYARALAPLARDMFSSDPPEGVAEFVERQRDNMKEAWEYVDRDSDTAFGSWCLSFPFLDDLRGLEGSPIVEDGVSFGVRYPELFETLFATGGLVERNRDAQTSLSQVLASDIERRAIRGDATETVAAYLSFEDAVVERVRTSFSNRYGEQAWEGYPHRVPQHLGGSGAEITLEITTSSDVFLAQLAELKQSQLALGELRKSRPVVPPLIDVIGEGNVLRSLGIRRVSYRNHTVSSSPGMGNEFQVRLDLVQDETSLARAERVVEVTDSGRSRLNTKAVASLLAPTHWRSGADGEREGLAVYEYLANLYGYEEFARDNFLGHTTTGRITFEHRRKQWDGSWLYDVSAYEWLDSAVSLGTLHTGRRSVFELADTGLSLERGRVIVNRGQPGQTGFDPLDIELVFSDRMSSDSEDTWEEAPTVRTAKYKGMDRWFPRLAAFLAYLPSSNVPQHHREAFEAGLEDIFGNRFLPALHTLVVWVGREAALGVETTPAVTPLIPVTGVTPLQFPTRRSTGQPVSESGDNLTQIVEDVLGEGSTAVADAVGRRLKEAASDIAARIASSDPLSDAYIAWIGSSEFVGDDDAAEAEASLSTLRSRIEDSRRALPTTQPDLMMGSRSGLGVRDPVTGMNLVGYDFAYGPGDAAFDHDALLDLYDDFEGLRRENALNLAAAGMAALDYHLGKNLSSEEQGRRYREFDEAYEVVLEEVGAEAARRGLAPPPGSSTPPRAGGARDSGGSAEAERLFDVAEARRYLPYFFAAAERHGIPASVLLALCHKESTMGTNVGPGWTQIGGGPAVGIMQIEPRWHPRFDASRKSDHAYVIDYAADFFKGLINQFDDDLYAAFAAYNKGAGTVRANLRSGRDADTQRGSAGTPDYARTCIGYTRAYQLILNQEVVSPFITGDFSDLPSQWFDPADSSPGSFATQRYGAEREGGVHAGVDYPMPVGSPVYAAADGQVGLVRDDGANGITVWIRHGIYQSRYLHLDEALVSEGDPIGGGAVIGRSGRDADDTVGHLHFEVREYVGGTWRHVDPASVETGSFDPLGRRKAESLLESFFDRTDSGGNLRNRNPGLPQDFGGGGAAGSFDEYRLTRDLRDLERLQVLQGMPRGAVLRPEQWAYLLRTSMTVLYTGRVMEFAREQFRKTDAATIRDVVQRLDVLEPQSNTAAYARLVEAVDAGEIDGTLSQARRTLAAVWDADDETLTGLFGYTDMGSERYRADLVDKLQRQYLQPVGMRRAFPAYALLLTNPTGVPGYALMQNVYAYTAVQSLETWEDADNAGRYARVRVSNMRGKLRSAEDYRYVLDYSPDADLVDQDRAYRVDVGQHMHVYLGYGPDIGCLEGTAGRVTEILPGPVTEFTLSSYSSTLLNPISGGLGLQIDGFDAQATLSDVLMTMLAKTDGLEGLGRSTYFEAMDRLGRGPRGEEADQWAFGLYAGLLNLWRKLGKVWSDSPYAGSFNHLSEDETGNLLELVAQNPGKFAQAAHGDSGLYENVFFVSGAVRYGWSHALLGEAIHSWLQSGKGWSWMTMPDQTLWSAMRELALLYPDYIVTTRPYNQGQPVWRLGDHPLRETLYIGPKHGRYIETSNPVRPGRSLEQYVRRALEEPENAALWSDDARLEGVYRRWVLDVARRELRERAEAVDPGLLLRLSQVPGWPETLDFALARYGYDAPGGGSGLRWIPFVNIPVPRDAIEAIQSAGEPIGDALLEAIPNGLLPESLEASDSNEAQRRRSLDGDKVIPRSLIAQVESFMSAPGLFANLAEVHPGFNPHTPSKGSHQMGDETTAQVLARLDLPNPDLAEDQGGSRVETEQLKTDILAAFRKDILAQVNQGQIAANYEQLLESEIPVVQEAIAQAVSEGYHTGGSTRPVVEHHLASPYTNMIMNETRASVDGDFANRVTLSWPKDPSERLSAAAQPGRRYSYSVQATPTLPPDNIVEDQVYAPNMRVHWGDAADITADSERELGTSAEDYADRVREYDTLLREGSGGATYSLSGDNYLNRVAELEATMAEYGRRLNESLYFKPKFRTAACNVLRDRFQNMYTGSVTLAGDPTIKPHHMLHLFDDVNQIVGPVDVGGVHHALTTEGFQTVIRPRLACALQGVDPQLDALYMDYASRAAAFVSGVRRLGQTFAGGAALAVKYTILRRFLGSAMFSKIVEKVGQYAATRGAGLAVGPVGAVITTAWVLKDLVDLAGTVADAAEDSDRQYVGLVGRVQDANPLVFAPLVRRGKAWTAGLEGVAGAGTLSQSVAGTIDETRRGGLSAENWDFLLGQLDPVGEL